MTTTAKERAQKALDLATEANRLCQTIGVDISKTDVEEADAVMSLLTSVVRVADDVDASADAARDRMTSAAHALVVYGRAYQNTYRNNKQSQWDGGDERGFHLTFKESGGAWSCTMSGHVNDIHVVVTARGASAEDALDAVRAWVKEGK